MCRYFVESLLNVKLTRSSLFHSHLEHLPGLQQSEFSKQVRELFKITQKINFVTELNLKDHVISPLS